MPATIPNLDVQETGIPRSPAAITNFFSQRTHLLLKYPLV